MRLVLPSLETVFDRDYQSAARALREQIPIGDEEIKIDTSQQVLASDNI